MRAPRIRIPSRAALLLACIACSSGPSRMMAPPGGQVILVGASANADYASLVSAVAAVPPGTTLMVEAGTYTEKLVIGKPLTLIGAGPATVVEYPPTGPSDAGVIEIRSTFGVRLESISVRSTPLDVDGIRVRDSNGIVLEGIEASNNSSDGIDVRRSAGVDIFDCQAESNGGDGVQIDETSQNVHVARCRTASNGVDGIKFRSSSGGLLEANTCSFNLDDGIVVRDASGVTLDGNTVTDNGGAGILVENSPGTVLTNNITTGNAAGDLVCDAGPCS